MSGPFLQALGSGQIRADELLDRLYGDLNRRTTVDERGKVTFDETNLEAQLATVLDPSEVELAGAELRRLVLDGVAMSPTARARGERATPLFPWRLLRYTWFAQALGPSGMKSLGITSDAEPAKVAERLAAYGSPPPWLLKKKVLSSLITASRMETGFSFSVVSPDRPASSSAWKKMLALQARQAAAAGKAQAVIDLVIGTSLPAPTPPVPAPDPIPGDVGNAVAAAAACFEDMHVQTGWEFPLGPYIDVCWPAACAAKIGQALTGQSGPAVRAALPAAIAAAAAAAASSGGTATGAASMATLLGALGGPFAGVIALGSLFYGSVLIHVAGQCSNRVCLRWRPGALILGPVFAMHPTVRCG